MRRCDREGVDPPWPRREHVGDPVAMRAWNLALPRPRLFPPPFLRRDGYVVDHLREPAALPSPAAAAERGR